MDLPTNHVVNFLSPISPPSKLISNPASPDETPAPPLPSTNNPTTTNPDGSSSLSTGLNFSISIPENDQSENTQELPPFNFFPSNVRPLLSRPYHIKLRTDHPILGRQHRREENLNRARKTKQPRFNQQLQYSLKPEFSTWKIVLWDSRRQEYTIQSTSLPSQRLLLPQQAITSLRC